MDPKMSGLICRQFSVPSVQQVGPRDAGEARHLGAAGEQPPLT
jgi:hypothetical protein